MTIDSTTKAKLRKASRKIEEWTQERDQVIREAEAAGGTLTEIAEAVGMSHTAVKYIARGRPPRKDVGKRAAIPKPDVPVGVQGPPGPVGASGP